MGCRKCMKDVFTIAFLLMLKKSYRISCQLIKIPIVQINVLLRLIENWKKSRDYENFAGTVLMDFSKTFACIRHNSLAAKLHAYGLSEDGGLCINT